jgi:hypothetical protein
MHGSSQSTTSTVVCHSTEFTPSRLPRLQGADLAPPPFSSAGWALEHQHESANLPRQCLWCLTSASDSEVRSERGEAVRHFSVQRHSSNSNGPGIIISESPLQRRDRTRALRTFWVVRRCETPAGFGRVSAQNKPLRGAGWWLSAVQPPQKMHGATTARAAHHVKLSAAGNDLPSSSRLRARWRTTSTWRALWCQRRMQQQQQVFRSGWWWWAMFMAVSTNCASFSVSLGSALTSPLAIATEQTESSSLET